jgi:hypothetical protein
VCVIAGVAFVTACSSGHGHSTTPTTRKPTVNSAPTVPTTGLSLQRFSGNDGTLSFSHPRTWRETRYTRVSSFSDLIVYLSNAPLHDPCRTNGGTTTCGWPLTKLHPGDVLVSWSNIGFPHTGPEIPHPNTTIGGQPAAVHVSRAGNGMCTGLGQNETVTADIARPRGNHYEMVACLRGPNLTRNEAFVREMLASTRVSG